MTKININKIAVKFDVENTTKELFNAVVSKFVEFGHYPSDVAFCDLKKFNILLVDQYPQLCMCNIQWIGIEKHGYVIISPQEFLALGNIPQEQPVVDNTTIIAEWLNKLQSLLDKDKILHCLDFTTMTLVTDFGDVYEPEGIVNFVNRRYDEITNSENTQKKAQLEAKRQKLMDELSEIDQQLGLYN